MTEHPNPTMALVIAASLVFAVVAMLFGLEAVGGALTALAVSVAVLALARCWRALPPRTA